MSVKGQGSLAWIWIPRDDKNKLWSEPQHSLEMGLALLLASFAAQLSSVLKVLPSPTLGLELDPGLKVSMWVPHTVGTQAPC